MELRLLLLEEITLLLWLILYHYWSFLPNLRFPLAILPAKALITIIDCPGIINVVHKVLIMKSTRRLHWLKNILYNHILSIPISTTTNEGYDIIVLINCILNGFMTLVTVLPTYEYPFRVVSFKRGHFLSPPSTTVHRPLLHRSLAWKQLAVNYSSLPALVTLCARETEWVVYVSLLLLQLSMQLLW